MITPTPFRFPSAALPRPFSARRLAVIALLATLCISLSGCVYLRLLKFKNQLKEFDAHVQVDQENGLALVMREPVLLDSDFIFITESPPTDARTLQEAPPVEEWSWLFRKKPDSDSDRAPPFAITFLTRFESNQLTRIEFDPGLLSVIPKEFIVELFRSLGQARINKLRRSATASMSAEDLQGVPLPSLAAIEQVMGEPTREVDTRKGQIWRYTFNFHHPESGEVAGQFKLVFRSNSDDLHTPISGFELTGKAR